MYTVAIELSFSAAHQLRFKNGETEPLHGHNWRVQIVISREEVDSEGLVLDFGKLKKEARTILNHLDNSFINEVAPFDRINPSAENIAFYIYEELGKKLPHDSIRIQKVTVWETEDASASYVA